MKKQQSIPVKSEGVSNDLSPEQKIRIRAAIDLIIEYYFDQLYRACEHDPAKQDLKLVLQNFRLRHTLQQYQLTSPRQKSSSG